MKPNNTNNFKELNDSNLQKNSFEVPDNYFNNIEDIVFAKLKAEVLYKNDTPEIPNDYFDEIDSTILKKITPKNKVISLRNRIIKIGAPIAIAASILFAVILTNNSQAVTFDSLSTADLDYWIEQEIINDTEIAIIFNENELSDIYLETNASEDEIFNYLKNNEIENLIYEN